MISDSFSRLLFIHGSLVLFGGIVCGYFFWARLLARRIDLDVRPWRVAHSTLIATGLTLLVAGLLGPQLALSRALRMTAAVCLVASGWGFTIAMIAGALTGIRGLAPQPLGWNTILFLAHLIGAGGATIGVGIIVYGILS